MKITDINIHRFGPVEDFRLEAAPITVIYGSNESGKTTILDAVLEALFSVSTREVGTHFEGIDRYDKENALDGNVCIERRGVVITYPSSAGDTLDKLAGFPPVYIRNLLVVRESDLQFYDRYGTWWLEIKDHLSGFEGGFKAVSDVVRNTVGLTEDGDWINEKGRRVRDEVNNLKETGQRLQSLQVTAQEYARLRSDMRQLSLKREVAQKHLLLLKRAQRKEQIETAAVLRRKLIEERARAAELSGFDDDAHATWRKLESDIKAAREGLMEIESRKNSCIGRINDTEKEIAHQEEKARTWARKEADILPEVETGLQEIKAFYERERRLLSYQNFLIGATILLSALALLFLVFAFFRTLITNKLYRSEKVYSDLDIKIQIKESRTREFLQSASALGGIALGLLLELFSSFDLELVFILYSFISGVILYTIVREVIPEKEKGKPLYFVIGALGFTIIIMLINIFTTLIQLG